MKNHRMIWRRVPSSSQVFFGRANAPYIFYGERLDGTLSRLSRLKRGYTIRNVPWSAVEKEEPTILYIQSEPGVPERLNQIVPESLLEKYHVLQNTEKCLLLLRRGVRPVGL